MQSLLYLVIKSYQRPYRQFFAKVHQFCFFPSDLREMVAIGEGVDSSESSAVCGLPQIDRQFYHGMMNELLSVMKRTNLYLQETNCTTAHLVTCVMDVRYMKCDSNESPLKSIVSATSITDVMSGLTAKQVITFEHFSTIKRIIVTLCSESEGLQMELKAYEDKFSQSKILKSVKFYDEKYCSHGSEDMVELIITTDSSWNECPGFMKVLELEDTIANAFQCELFALHLRSIDHEPLSQRLSFAVSPKTLKSVFPLTTEEWASISNHGVVELKCYEFHYKVHSKGNSLHKKYLFSHFKYMYDMYKCGI